MTPLVSLIVVKRIKLMRWFSQKTICRQGVFGGGVEEYQNDGRKDRLFEANQAEVLCKPSGHVSVGWGGGDEGVGGDP